MGATGWVRDPDSYETFRRHKVMMKDGVERYRYCLYWSPPSEEGDSGCWTVHKVLFRPGRKRVPIGFQHRAWDEGPPFRWADRLIAVEEMEKI